MRLRWANNISTFLRSLRDTRPSQDLAMARAMSGEAQGQEDLMQLGIIARAFLKSQTKPVILLIDEIDKVDSAIDTFFLGPIQEMSLTGSPSQPAFQSETCRS